MCLGKKLQKFFNLKIQEKKIKRKEFQESTNIDVSTTNNIVNGRCRNPTLMTLVKIADYFNCSIDEVIGRNKKYYLFSQNYKNLTNDYMMNSLKEFIQHKLTETNLSKIQLAKTIGLSEKVFFKFLDNKGTQKNLSTITILILADHFNISIDSILNRIDNVQSQKYSLCNLNHFIQQSITTSNNKKAF